VNDRYLAGRAVIGPDPRIGAVWSVRTFTVLRCSLTACPNGIRRTLLLGGTIRGGHLTLTMRLQWEGLPVASGYRVDSIVVREGRELAGQIPLSGNLPVLELRL